jgi:RNA 2',3'-cyclic 3'-phosphodiesterase
MPGTGRARRLFVALEVPPEVRATIEAAFAPWRAALPTARWVPPANLHITVRFLGPVRPEVVDDVGSAVEAAAATIAPFASRLDAVGAFPSPARARVLWAGLDDRPGRMAALALAMDAALAPSFGAEVRAFRPHLTVGRCDPAAHLPVTFGATPFDPVRFEVVRAVLFESVSGGEGPPRYETVAVYPLAG